MKRIITCSDGTWNKPNMTYNGKVVKTNVQLLFDLIASQGNGKLQIKHYDAGVGAAGNWFTRLVSGATGEGIDDNILSAYKFICWNYEPGDEVYLFGFSRGAYTARSLGGLIRKCGFIKSSDLNLFDHAYELYRDKKFPSDSDKAKQFRLENSYEPSIKFIGVWDTVGALGIPLAGFQWYNKQKYTFYDTTLSSIIDHAYHAIAIDEKRKNFEPTLWEPSKNLVNRPTPQVLEQRWFSGVHSNIGGGYPDTGLSDITLTWMMEKAMATGLVLDSNALSKLKADAGGQLYNSKTGIFSLLPDYIRPIKKDSIIDETVPLRMKNVSNYQPRNQDYFN